jgi:hypothetical protein
MRVLRAENERLRQRLERMERRVRGADVSPSSPAAASPRPPVRIAAAATLTSTPVAPPPLVRENALADNNNKRWKAQKRTAAEAALSASDADHHRQQQPSSAAKMIKLEADVSRHIPAYGGSSRCDFPLAHCDNLTDEIFAESDESFSYCCSTAVAAAVPDTHRAINGVEAAAAVTAVVTPPSLKHEPDIGIHADDVVERRRVVTGGVKSSGQLLKQSSVASGEKVKRRAGRPSSHQSLTAPPVPGTVARL